MLTCRHGKVKVCAQKGSLRCVTRAAATLGEATHISRAALRPGTLGSVVMPGYANFQTTHQDLDTSVVTSRGFRGAASSCVLQVWVQERATQAAFSWPRPRPVSKSFLHVGDVAVRREDTSRASIQVIEPLLRDLSVTEILNPRDLLRGSFAAKGVFRMPEASAFR